MAKAKRKAVFLLSAAVLGICFFINLMYVNEINVYDTTAETLYNPLMGFAVNADYVEAVGENTLVYVDITWREWEPEEGIYDIEGVKAENNWDRWKNEGKNVVLRFVCDEPTNDEHMDIPDWLYEKTGDGVFYEVDYGRGYAPDYNNEIFIEAHEKAIMALGEAFGRDSMVAYVELGSLGHWGEWHMQYSKGTTRMPEQEVRTKYVLPYLEAFPKARIMARRPFAETAALGLGLYNDMTGDPESTLEWLEWIEEGGIYSQPVVKENLSAQPDIWESAPIGGEFTSSRSLEDMLVNNLDRTINLLRSSHTTFIGPKCPVRGELYEYKEGVDKVLQNIGYRYRVSSSSLSYFKWSDEGKLKLTVENTGTAPIYFPWKMYLYIYYEGSYDTPYEKEELPVDLSSLYGGGSVEVTVEGIPVGEDYTYGVCIENPDTGKPAVYLDMDCESRDKIYMLFGSSANYRLEW